MLSKAWQLNVKSKLEALCVKQHREWRVHREEVGDCIGKAGWGHTTHVRPSTGTS